MSARVGRLVASGKPVEVTRYVGTVGQGIMLQLAAETGYVQVQLAELLRMLVNPRPPLKGDMKQPMRFNCGACAYEFSTVSAPDPHARRYVTDETADGDVEADVWGTGLGKELVNVGDVLERAKSVRFWECPRCGALVFPFGLRGHENTGQPVETWEKRNAPPVVAGEPPA